MDEIYSRNNNKPVTNVRGTFYNMHVLNMDRLETLDDCKKMIKFLCNQMIHPLPDGIEYNGFEEVKQYFDN